MKHGDIANSVTTTVGVRCIDCLVKYKEGDFVDSLLNTILGKYSRAVVDEEVLGFMTYIYRQTEYNVDLVIEDKDNTVSLMRFLEENNVPFNRAIIVNEAKQITQRLMTNDITYYLDTDESRRSLVNSEYAMGIAELHNLLKRRVR